MAEEFYPHHWGPFVAGGAWGATRFYIAKRQARALLVLVHGFRTQSAKTWPETDEMILADDAFDTADIILWDYDSESGNIPQEVVTFRGALDTAWAAGPSLIAGPLAFVTRETKRQMVPTYERLILVGYSLGAYLVRAVASRAGRDRRQPPWFADLHIGLFAPAHLGARVLGAFRSDGGPFDWLKKNVRRGPARAVDVLVKGSRHLRNLKTRTEALYRAGERVVAARWIMYGYVEIVVFLGKFSCDPDVQRSPWKDHGNVQKANEAYQTPVDVIERLLP